jgi:hypothetical protein
MSGNVAPISAEGMISTANDIASRTAVNPASDEPSDGCSTA